jgi:polysaccharide biosynthesis transport protein
VNAASDAVSGSEEPGPGGGLVAQIEAIRRRALPIGVAFGSVLALALLLAAFWPATYLSTGTILIERQEIPEDFVRSAVSSYADQRVQVISQRVMTSTNLLAIMGKYKLYADERGSVPREALVERMRNDIKLHMISADVLDPQRGGASKATIAFAVGYESRSPDLAVAVANDVVSLYLRENLETRKRLAAGSTEFLTSEGEKLRLRVAELNQRLAEFKRQNYDRLPEFSASNQQSMASNAAEQRDVDYRIGALDQRIDFIDTQLAQMDPHGQAVNAGGERLMGPADRLQALRIELTTALSMYTPKHPKVIGLQQEIAELERVVAEDRANRSSGTPDNPAYIQLTAQRREATSERDALRARRGQLQANIARSQRAQADMPAVEAQYVALVSEVEGEQAKYNELRQKQMTAQLSQNLETEQKGERFTLIEPPVRPQEPIRPNRPAILALGLLMAVGAAIATLVLLEAIDTRVRGRREIVTMLGVPPLAVIPWVVDESNVDSRGRARVRLAGGALGGAIATLLLVHVLVKPLDVLWAMLLRRLGS